MYEEMKQKTDSESEQINHTGIPTQMKQHFENISGISLQDVRVHYHSDRPARMGAYAYTQGNQVYIGPGQEQYLAHELGHVIQQKQGRVKPTGYLNGQAVNDSKELEEEADSFAEG